MFRRLGKSGIGIAVLFCGLATLALCGCNEKRTSEESLVNTALSSSDEAVYMAGYDGSGGVERGFVKQRKLTGWDTLWNGDGILSDIWALSDTRAIAVGDNRVVSVVDGVATSMTLGSLETPLQSVWAASSTDVFVVGFGGTIYRGTPTELAPMDSPVEDDLHGLWGSSATDVFAVGKAGTIVHFDGSTWQNQESGTDFDLAAVWGTGPSDVFAVGGTEDQPGCAILHYDGTSWTKMSSCDARNIALLGMHGLAGDDVFAVGGNRLSNGQVESLVLHYDGTDWSEVSSDFAQFLWDVQAYPDEFAVVGAGDTRAFVGR